MGKPMKSTCEASIVPGPAAPDPISPNDQMGIAPVPIHVVLGVTSCPDPVVEK